LFSYHHLLLLYSILPRTTMTTVPLLIEIEENGLKSLSENPQLSIEYLKVSIESGELSIE
jgi:hypothetical protein